MNSQPGQLVMVRLTPEDRHCAEHLLANMHTRQIIGDDEASTLGGLLTGTLRGWTGPMPVATADRAADLFTTCHDHILAGRFRTDRYPARETPSGWRPVDRPTSRPRQVRSR